MKIVKNIWLISSFMVCSILTLSCSESFLENDLVAIDPTINEGPPSLSENNYMEGKEVTYSIEGNYSGKIDLTVFLYNNIPIVPIKQLDLPYENTFKVPDTSSVIGGYANGFYKDGNAGEVANLKMFYEDRLLYSVVRQSNDDGINLSLETYNFESLNHVLPIKLEHIGKKVTYAIESNSDGPQTIIYQLQESGWEDISTELPYAYSFTTNEQSQAASLRLGDQELEKVGDSITLKLYVDDQEIESSTFTRIGESEYHNDGPILFPFY